MGIRVRWLFGSLIMLRAFWVKKTFSLMLTPDPDPPELLSWGFCNVIVIETKFCESGSKIVAFGAISVWTVVALTVLLLPASFGPFRSTTGAMSGWMMVVITDPLPATLAPVVLPGLDRLTVYCSGPSTRPSFAAPRLITRSLIVPGVVPVPSLVKVSTPPTYDSVPEVAAFALYAAIALLTAVVKSAWSGLVVLISVKPRLIVAVSPACSVPARCTV